VAKVASDWRTSEEAAASTCRECIYGQFPVRNESVCARSEIVDGVERRGEGGQRLAHLQRGGSVDLFTLELRVCKLDTSIRVQYQKEC